ncbi:transcriptional regulator FilR1 domain-containing protein [uncultured Methanolobus sp.]|uniref:transcriptional regulator FilR1 domain-containing protein n=1 Tax=uncultured Methanolobus sp. TaxID=218300 RepID=UPI00374785C6
MKRIPNLGRSILWLFNERGDFEPKHIVSRLESAINWGKDLFEPAMVLKMWLASCILTNNQNIPGNTTYSIPEITFK